MSYTDVGVAHAELLLVTWLEKEIYPGNKNLRPPMRPLKSSLLPPVPQIQQKEVPVALLWDKEDERRELDKG